MIPSIFLEHHVATGTHNYILNGHPVTTEFYGLVLNETVRDEIYDFEDLPCAIRELQNNTQTGIWIVRIAREMPGVVRSLIA